MRKKENKLQESLKQICKDKRINYKELSYGLILEIEKNNKKRYVIGQKIDLNKQAASCICSDKYATYSVMKSNNLPVIEHKILFNPLIRPGYIPNDGNLKIAEDYRKENNNKIVVKPNNGNSGIDVFLCDNKKNLDEKINYLFKEKNNSTISLCPYYDIDIEYRNVYLKGKCLLTYGKMKQEEKSWKCNLCNGAIPYIETDEKVLNILNDITVKAGNALNLEFVTVDIIRTKSGEYYIIEINSSVCLAKFSKMVPNGEKIVYDIYSKAIDELF